jgi:hypothetical protein
MTSMNDLNNALDAVGEVPCQSAPDLFFTDPEQFNGYAHINSAKSLCITCPIRQTCLSYALDNNETDGIWGGTVPSERVKMKRVRRQGSLAYETTRVELAS